MGAFVRLFIHNLYDWTIVHPETGLGVLVICTAISISVYIMIRSGKR
jgi:hypothetical protein